MQSFVMVKHRITCFLWLTYAELRFGRPGHKVTKCHIHAEYIAFIYKNDSEFTNLNTEFTVFEFGVTAAGFVRVSCNMQFL